MAADMDMHEFKEHFDAVFADLLQQRLAKTTPLLRESAAAAGLRQVGEIFGRRGKRVRPYVLHAMYETAGGTDQDVALLAGVSVELQHAFALIQDDVIDRDNTRHSVSTVHATIVSQLAASGTHLDTEHIANSQAMLIGDLLSSWSYSVASTISSSYKDRFSMLLQEMIERVIIGEMIDVSFPLRQAISDDELQQRDMLKTSSYTFVSPLLMGAVLAGKEEKYRAFCEEFGMLLGAAYQIRDDIEDIVSDGEVADKPDIHEHQHTYLTQYARAHGTKADQDALTLFFSGARPDSRNEEDVLKIVSSLQVLEPAQKAIAQHLEKARQSVRRAGFAVRDAQRWLDLIALLEKRST